jgi:aspartyl-tRNA(Asn)/glutamyl-tRNA(Gln) amidotransferase subunit A
MAGYDPRDPTTSREPVPDYAAGMGGGIADAVIGVPVEFIRSDALNVQPEILAAFEEALHVLESAGARLEEVRIPGFEFCTLVSFVIYATEFFAANMHDLEEFHEVSPLYRVARACLGALTPAADYLRAQRLRAQYMRDVNAVLERVDFIATPAQTRTAALIGPPDDGIAGLMRQMQPDFWSLWNLVGLPALTVPCGSDSGGLPIGLQLGGKAFHEGDLLRAAHTYQTLTDWHTRRPPLD